MLESLVSLRTNGTELHDATNSSTAHNRSARSIPDYSQYRGNNFDGINDEGEKGYHHFRALSDLGSGTYAS